jgi:hypothetical protein
MEKFFWLTRQFLIFTATKTMNYGLIRAVRSECYSTQHILFLVLNTYVC